MAIRIRQGTSPQAGRITMPRGTYLSNPSTAASGALGGPAGTNPPPGMVPVGVRPVPQIDLSRNFAGFTPPQTSNPFLNTAIQVAQNPSTINPYGGVGTPTAQVPTMWQDLKDWFTGTGKYGKNPDQFLRSFFEEPKPTPAFDPQSSSNQLVGMTGMGAMPSRLDLGTLQQIMPGKDFNQIAEIMRLKGYEWLPYNGGFFANATGTGAGSEEAQKKATSGGPLDERGRVMANPFELGATLEPGERAVTAGGYGVTGGTPYTDASGNTVSQYAVTIPGKGDRWKFNIKKDNAGNWVRIYYRTYGAARTRRFQKNRNQQPQTPEQQAGEAGYQQLVTLRANYG